MADSYFDDDSFESIFFEMFASLEYEETTASDAHLSSSDFDDFDGFKDDVNPISEVRNSLDETFVDHSTGTYVFDGEHMDSERDWLLAVFDYMRQDGLDETGVDGHITARSGFDWVRMLPDGAIAGLIGFLGGEEFLFECGYYNRGDTPGDQDGEQFRQFM